MQSVSAGGQLAAQQQHGSVSGATSTSASIHGAVNSHRKMLRERMLRNGKKLTQEYTYAMLTSVGMCMLCVGCYLVTGPICESRPVSLKLWFLIMAVLEGIAALIFSVRHYIMTSLLKDWAALAQEARRRRTTPRQAAQADPRRLDRSARLWKCMTASSVLILKLVLATMAWSVVGLLCMLDPLHLDFQNCKNIRLTVLGVSILSIAQSCCCQCCPITDLHQLQATVLGEDAEGDEQSPGQSEAASAANSQEASGTVGDENGDADEWSVQEEAVVGAVTPTQCPRRQRPTSEAAVGAGSARRAEGPGVGAAGDEQGAGQEGSPVDASFTEDVVTSV